jgi:hypothetical protein
MAEKQSNAPLYGVLAEFETASGVYHACEKVRDAGFKKWDAHTPFAVHGLDKAMGLKPSKLPFVILAMGLLGAAGAMALQWWTSAVDYKYIIAGKPYFSWPAFIPVTFEVMVLLAALGALFGLLHFCQLPQLYHPLFRSERFERVTNDRFFIAIEAADPSFDVDETPKFLAGLGASHVELVED